MKFNFMIALVASAIAVSGCGKTDSKSESKTSSAKTDSAKTDSAKTVSSGKTDSEKITGAKTPEVELTEEQMIESELAKLSPEDRAMAEKQKICPLGQKPLGYMPGLKRVDLDGERVVFICCEGCEKPLRKNPEKWLANLDWYQGMPEKKQD